MLVHHFPAGLLNVAGVLALRPPIRRYARRLRNFDRDVITKVAGGGRSHRRLDRGAGQPSRCPANELGHQSAFLSLPGEREPRGRGESRGSELDNGARS